MSRRQYLFFLDSSIALLGVWLSGVACSGQDTSPLPPISECTAGESASTVEKITTHNRLNTNAIMFNALSSNPKALPLVLASPLRSKSYACGANDSTDDSCYLGRQLLDVWTREMFHFLAVCALPEGTAISWVHPVTNEVYFWPGEQGLCPKWLDGGIDSNSPEDRECQELVSACVLASNNAHGEMVRISIRGVRQDAPLPWTLPSASFPEDDLASVNVCTADSPQLTEPTDRDCDWQLQYVGTCRPGSQVSVGPEIECTGTMMARVCADKAGCDAVESLAADSDFCRSRGIDFTCPASGRFNLMSARRSPNSPGEVVATATGGVYPASENEIFSAREGAFYGNIFERPSGVDALIGVEVDDSGAVMYTYPDANNTLTTTQAYHTGCDSYETLDPEDQRSAKHQEFIDSVGYLRDMYGDAQGLVQVYPKMYGCYAPAWTTGAAYVTKRSCAGPDNDWKFCAARPLGPCWIPEDPAQGRCGDEDGAVGGDRDFSQCQDDSGTAWQHPVTVFLDDPCTVVTDLNVCTMRTMSGLSPDNLPTSAAGNNHTCAAVNEDRDLRCWGRGAEYQLGTGDTRDIGDDEFPDKAGNVPVFGPTETPLPIVQVVAGSQHSCVLLADGTARCWGANSSGQLGYPGTLLVSKAEDAAPLTLPPIAMLAAGQEHTCALLASGAVHCWGKGANGRLGYGDILDRDDPGTAVSLGGIALEITAGDAHTCALVDSGLSVGVRCWGKGINGRLGYRGTTDLLAPPAEDVRLGGPARTIAAGLEHTCAILVDNTIRCWGKGVDGRLGYGDTQDVGDDEYPMVRGAVSVGGSATALALGAAHTCALLDNKDVRCWGSGASGRLGYGNTDDIGDNELPSSVGPVELGYDVRAITVGTAHTCAVLEVPYTGLPTVMRCWGQAAFGRLGYGNNNDIGDDERPMEAGSVPVF